MVCEVFISLSDNVDSLLPVLSTRAIAEIVLMQILGV